MNTKCTTDWFVFIQQEHNLAPKCLPVYYGFEGHNGPVKAIMDRSYYLNKKKLKFYETCNF
jgi:hypothetical protein